MHYCFPLGGLGGLGVLGALYNTPMKRWAWHLFCLFSLLVFASSLTLWARSYSWQEGFSCQRYVNLNDSGGLTTTWNAYWETGTLYISRSRTHRGTNDQPSFTRWRFLHYPIKPGLPSPSSPMDLTNVHFAGFFWEYALDQTNTSLQWSRRMLGLPFWLFLILVVPPLRPQLLRRDHANAISPCQSPAKSIIFSRVFPSNSPLPEFRCIPVFTPTHKSPLYGGPTFRSRFFDNFKLLRLGRRSSAALPARCAFWCVIVHFPTPPGSKSLLAILAILAQTKSKPKTKPPKPQGRFSNAVSPSRKRATSQKQTQPHAPRRAIAVCPSSQITPSRASCRYPANRR